MKNGEDMVIIFIITLNIIFPQLLLELSEKFSKKFCQGFTKILFFVKLAWTRKESRVIIVLQVEHAACI